MKRILYVGLFCLWAMSAWSQTYYVDARKGNDANDGSEARPWQTVEKARDFVRALERRDGVTVRLCGTFAYPKATLELNEKDSGTTYGTFGDGALFIGGIAIPSEHFTPVTDESIRKRLKPQVGEKVLCCDLAKLGLDSIPPLPKQFRNWENVELFAGGKAMPLARFPNQGWLEIARVIDRGVKPVDRATGEWEFGYKGGTFEFTEDEPLRWDVSQGVWLNGFWCHDWSNETLQVAQIDKEKKTFTMGAVHTYGIGNSSKWHTAKRRYYALNILEELDSPGEWYLDVATNRLYFYPPEEGLGEVFLACQKQSLLQLKNAQNVTLENLRFAYSVGAPVTVSQCQNVVLRRLNVSNTTAGGIRISGGKNCVLEDSEISQIGGLGVSVSGGNRKTLERCDHQVLHNHIHHCGRLQRTGGACIAFHGVGCRIAHNLFHDTPYICVQYGGNEHLFEYNEVHSAMMEAGDGGGMYTGRDWGSCGNVVQFNYFHHYGQAGVDWQKERGLNPNYEPLKENVMVMGVYLDDCDSGDTIQNNIFYRTGWSMFVGGGRYNKIYNNLFLDCTAATHLDVRGLSRLKLDDTGDPSWRLPRKLEALGYKESPWKERYPFLLNILDDEPLLPLHNEFRNNVAIHCKTWLQMHGDVRKTCLDRIPFSGNVVFDYGTDKTKADFTPDRVDFRDDPLPANALTPEADGFKIQEEIHRRVPQFQIIPLEKIGRK
ncbi:MAG: right-handed parallel beta-helix repeat-containing protein [Planctomycetia bacterium]|nr:right-handed parallel beta-helix repeat-containing protein [Planctomycetia bacterium]